MLNALVRRRSFSIYRRLEMSSYMDSNASAKAIRASQRTLKKFEEIERKKLAEMKRRREERPMMATAVKRRNYGKNPKIQLFEDTEKMKAFNKVFADSLTPVLSHPELNKDLVGRGISITKVRVKPDFSFVYIYWVSSQPDRDVETAEVLDKNSGDLRHAIEQYAALGKIPQIKFIKDYEFLRYSSLRETFKKLRETLGPYSAAAAAAAAVDDAPPSIKTQKGNDDDDAFPSPILDEFSRRRGGGNGNGGPLRSDALKVDRENIMKKIEASMQKSKAEHRLNKIDLVSEVEEEAEPDENILETIHDRRKFIKKFMRERNRAYSKLFGKLIK